MLVVGVARRDQVALAELHRRHSGSLLCSALRVLLVRCLAEDVVQDVFLRLWQEPERFDPLRGSLRSFLLTQCHGRAVDIVRSERARRHREGRSADAIHQVPHGAGDEILDFVDAQVVRDALLVLSEVERQAIGLAYFGGHTYADVARLLRIPEGTAKSRIRSGLARLRTAVVEAGIDPLTANRVAS